MSLKYIVSLRDYIFQYLNLIIRFGFAFFDGYGVLRTGCQTCAKAVAKQITYESGFSIDDLECTLGAVGNANAASVAFFLINIDDLPFHIESRFPERSCFRYCSKHDSFIANT